MNHKEITKIGMGPVKLNDSNIRALMNNPEIRESVLKHLKRLDAGVLHDAVIDGFFNTELPIVATYTEGEGEYKYNIDIVGVEGAFALRAIEHDAAGMFTTLEDAKTWVAISWWDAKELRPKRRRRSHR